MRAYLLIMVVAALVTFAATFLTLRLSRKHSIMPEIRERDVHTDPTPRIGGLAMLIGFLVSLRLLHRSVGSALCLKIRFTSSPLQQQQR